MRNKTVVILTCLRSCYCSSPWKRGWISLPAKVRGKQYQFVTPLGSSVPMFGGADQRTARWNRSYHRLTESEVPCDP